MDIEKYASSKLFMFFEWTYKLVIWNLLSLLVIAIFGAGPLIGFYTLQNNYSIENVAYITDVDDEIGIEVTLKNGNKTILEGFPTSREIVEYRVDDSYIYFVLKNKNEENITICLPNKEFIKTIDKIYFDDQNLIIEGMKKSFVYENVLLSPLSNEFSRIDTSNYTIIGLENGVLVNYGNVIVTKHNLAGGLMIVALLLIIFALIPCIVTIFSMIKIFGEDGKSDTFGLFFDRLWDNFKSLWKLELIIIPSLGLLAFALYIYYMIIQGGGGNFLYTASYNLILITLLLFVLWFVNLPMTLGYFRMNTYSIFKFTLIMAFKNILYTFLYVFLIVGMLLLCFIFDFFIPIWFLVGFSLPMYIIYLVSKKKYKALVHDFESYKDDDIYDLGTNED